MKNSTDNNKTVTAECTELPIIALRGLVLFPQTVMHFEVGRKKSVLALNEAINNVSDVFLVPQNNIFDEDPELDDLNGIGVIAQVRQVIKLSSENTRVVVEGKSRAFIKGLTKTKPFLKGEIVPLESASANVSELREKALMRYAKKLFEKYVTVSVKISPDIVMQVIELKTSGELADFIASNIRLEFEQKLEILNILDPIDRLNRLCTVIEKEIELVGIESEIEAKVQKHIDDNQREYFLREQLKVISEELGEDENNLSDADKFKKEISKLKLSVEVRQKLVGEADKLSRMPDSSHEALVVRNYLETCLSLPWNKSTKDKTDLARAQKILDKDHYGLQKVKERILEMIAVRALSNQNTGQILCLVGPPGVGKTSIAKSVASALGKKYARVSLGGVSDEAEIRGHRRTYIGSMPGRIINAVIQAKSNNALILLDEVDKLGSDYKGDPSSALLEALDPEQNNTFCDHYIDLPFDLSKILFMTTANTAETIPAPLLDRMELIELPSYTAREKFHICKSYLIRKQLEKNGLSSKTLRITDSAVAGIIDGYTREGGVRNLERCVGEICRKAARRIVDGTSLKENVTELNLEDFLGPQKFKREPLDVSDVVGVVNGLAWTAVGGEMLKVEVAVMDGTGKLELTGSLGDVMKESARAALSYVRSRTPELKIDAEFYKNRDIHIHVPEGAVPKDGPSAGVTITTAIVSALTKSPVRHNVAMTGEVTLTGRVLPIGGLREKSMAAYLMGIETVFIPYGNISDVSEISDEVKSKIKFVPVHSVDEVLEKALVPATESSHFAVVKKSEVTGINTVMQ